MPLLGVKLILIIYWFISASLTQCYRWRTVYLQCIQWLWKIQIISMIAQPWCSGKPLHKLTPCIISKRTETLGREKIVYIICIAVRKKHILGQSGVEQWRNQAHSFIHCLAAWRHQLVKIEKLFRRVWGQSEDIFGLGLPKQCQAVMK